MNSLLSYLPELYKIMCSSTEFFICGSIKISFALLVVLFLAKFRRMFNYKKVISPMQMHAIILVTFISIILVPIIINIFHLDSLEILTIRTIHDHHYKFQNTDSSDNANLPVESKKPVADWQPPIFMFWLYGIGIFTLKIPVGLYYINTLIKHSSGFTKSDYDPLLERIKYATGVKRKVRIIISRSIKSPCTFGFIKPVIILPVECNTWSYERIRLVLLHEMLHVKRFDTISFLYVQIVCAIFWINPLIWLAADKLHEEMESSCDDFVMFSGIKPYIYAEHIIEIIKGSLSVKSLKNVVAGINSSSNTEKRIRKILFDKKRGMCISFEFCISLVLITVLLTITTFNVTVVSGRINTTRLDMALKGNLVTLSSDDKTIEIVDAMPNDIPTLWPYGPYDTGVALSYNYNGTMWSSINASANTKDLTVFAAADGKVKKVHLLDNNYSVITIEHKYNLSTVYGYINDSNVSIGDHIRKGESIGKSRQDGIYFEIKNGKKSVDPVAFLEKDRLISMK